jgi:hypothetical protein
MNVGVSVDLNFWRWGRLLLRNARQGVTVSCLGLSVREFFSLSTQPPNFVISCIILGQDCGKASTALVLWLIGMIVCFRYTYFHLNRRSQSPCHLSPGHHRYSQIMSLDSYTRTEGSPNLPEPQLILEVMEACHCSREKAIASLQVCVLFT